MNSSSEDDAPSSPEGVFVARQPAHWLTSKNKRPSPSELITIQCPYNVRKTQQFQYKNQLWTVGDIVSLRSAQKSTKIFYAQILELFENELSEKRAKIIWLAPKSNIGVTDEIKKVHHNSFKPNAFVHMSVDKRLVPIECLTFVMSIPNQFEYKKQVGTDYLVDTYIISHDQRYAESDDDEGPKSKSKSRRLLHK